MPLLPTALASAMDVSIQNTTSEETARAAWASAWTSYFYAALAGAVPVTPGSLAPAESALSAGMAGLSTAGATSIQTGLSAFWGVVVASAPTVFAGATLVTPPPGLAGVAAALQPVFSANTAGGVSKTVALQAIASALHPLAGLGGTATFPGPVVLPIL